MDRLLALKRLPLGYDRELKELVFFFKCLNGFTDFTVHGFVSLIN